MTLLTLYPEDQADAEWTTRDRTDIAGWLDRIGVAFVHAEGVRSGLFAASPEADCEHTRGHPTDYLFLDGVGALHLHHQGRVYLLLCTPGDRVVVPAGMRHWLDRGPAGAHADVMVRSDAGAETYTVTDAAIARRFPPLEAYAKAVGASPALSRSP
ncbi:MAG: hypothetical protein HYR63_00465 [Proteobacteria bacterium]|nr:hypothetical protein [Pseudomonadota bacterium]